MAKPITVVVCGALGRMGSKVAELARHDSRFRVGALVDRPRDAASGGGPATAGVTDVSQIRKVLAGADVLIDFTVPDATVLAVSAAARAKVPAVVGTTGFNSMQSVRLRSAARSIPLLVAPNMSPGVNLMFHLCRIAASVLAGYELSISESHHSRKKDAPSGTALALARQLQESRGTGLSVPIVSQRMGDIVGEHTLTLAGPCERLEIVHRAHSRDLFARGALEAAAWVRQQRPGLYSLRDMLGL